MGNEFDDLFNDKVVELGTKQELYQRYADDIDTALRSIGRGIMFCPLDGCPVNKPEDQVEAESDLQEDEITMREVQKVADNLLKNIETEYDCPSSHPELGNKIPVLDLAMWVETVKVSSTGIKGQEMHSGCDKSDICLPLGESSENGWKENILLQLGWCIKSKLSSSQNPWLPKRSSWSPLPSPGHKRGQLSPKN